MIYKTIIIACAVSLITTAAFCQSDDFEMHIFKIKHGNIGLLYQTVESLKSPEGRVSLNAGTDSIIVFDFPATIQRIGSVIDMLDVQEKQVEVQVLVIETAAESLIAMGVASSRVVFPPGKFMAVAKFIAKDTHTVIRSQMSVLTMSNQPAQIQVTTDETIGTEVIQFDNGTEMIQPLRETVGNTLEVLPRANPDGTITLILRPSVSGVVRKGTLSEATLFTRVVINNGETVSLGGVEHEQEGSLDSLGLPISKRSMSEGKKVVMFLTARTQP